MSTLGIIGTVIGLVDKTLDLMPDYDQRKKAEWLKLKAEYNKQIALPLPERDADLILNLKESILLYADEVLKHR